MPYIVKSSLDISGKILPWNETEKEKLIKEKEEFIKAKSKETVKETAQKEMQERNLEKEEIKSSKMDKKKK